jgi:hypothetical protein
MIVCESTAHAYYPVRNRLQGVIRGTGRIRYVRGFLLVKPRAQNPEFRIQNSVVKS